MMVIQMLTTQTIYKLVIFHATEDSKPLVAFASIAFREDRSSSGADSSAPIIAHQVVDKYVEKYGFKLKKC